jgi:hypothetical protein
VTNPGAYRCVCVRLKLYSLAVTAVVKSEVLAELEGASSAAAGVDAGAAPAFRVLKQLVASWLTDASQHQNRRVTLSLGLCLDSSGALSQDMLHRTGPCCRMRAGMPLAPARQVHLRKSYHLSMGACTSKGGSLLRRFSDALLQNLWRWLCSPAAALACPGLQRSVAALMRKTLAQLVPLFLSLPLSSVKGNPPA